MSRLVSLSLFLVLAVGGGLVLGFLSVTGPWYVGIAKRWFNPPSWVFGPVWTVLYILVAVAGWRIWLAQ